MELVSMVKDMLQNVAEHVASYRIGQTGLRCLDRTLWVVEKCARWAVPPPLDQDERPQPELIRPLPWVFFLGMLIVLRVVRESVSLANLVMGRPPLRSADVVIYIQSKRRYLRTLKYQGNRIMRSRSGTTSRDSWYSSLRSVFEFTMCFRRSTHNYGNNNTTSVSNNDEVLVVKRSKRGREDVSPVASSSVESTMERLIEKMMVDLNADSDEDSNYTLTHVTSPMTEKSEVTTESDQDTVANNGSPATKPKLENSQNSSVDIDTVPTKSDVCSTQVNTDSELKEIESEHKNENESEQNKDIEQTKENKSEQKKENESEQKKENEIEQKKEKESEPKKENESESKKENKSDLIKRNDEVIENKNEEGTTKEDTTLTPKQESINFIQNERITQRFQRTPKNEKMANGRTVKTVPSKKKGSHLERREIEMTSSRTQFDKSF